MAANPLKGNEMMKKAWLVRARTGLLVGYDVARMKAMNPGGHTPKFQTCGRLTSFSYRNCHCTVFGHLGDIEGAIKNHGEISRELGDKICADAVGDTHVRSGPGIWKKKPRQGKDWLDV
jgi:hypothetical protein